MPGQPFNFYGMALITQANFHFVRTAWDFLIDLLFPIECLQCGREGEWLCQACFRRLAFRSVQACFHCKKEDNYGRFCPACGSGYFLDGIWIAGDYENQLLAEMIKALKYRFVRGLSAVLGLYAAIFLLNLINRARFARDLYRSPDGLKPPYPLAFFALEKTLLVPVPLHKKRLRWRGFNQAEKIASAVAGRLPLDFRPGLLKRAASRAPQAKLRERDRRRNIAGAFAWAGPGVLHGEHAILLDDVATTAATLNECARVLKDQGAGEVWGLVIAKG